MLLWPVVPALLPAGLPPPALPGPAPPPPAPPAPPPPRLPAPPPPRRPGACPARARSARSARSAAARAAAVRAAAAGLRQRDRCREHRHRDRGAQDLSPSLHAVNPFRDRHVAVPDRSVWNPPGS